MIVGQILLIANHLVQVSRIVVLNQIELSQLVPFSSII